MNGTATVERVERHTAVALIGSVLLIIGGVAAVLTAEDHPVAEALLSAGMLVTTLGYLAVHIAHRDAYGRVGAVSAVAAAVGQLLVSVAGIATAMPRSAPEELLTTIFFVGFMPLALGVLGVSIAMYRVGMLPRWSGLLLPVGLVVISVVGDRGGMALGAAWAVLLVLLRRSVPTLSHPAH